MRLKKTVAGADSAVCGAWQMRGAAECTNIMCAFGAETFVVALV